MLETILQLPPANIAFLILVTATFTLYPVVLAFAYVATGRDPVKQPRHAAPEAGQPAGSTLSVARAA